MDQSCVSIGILRLAKLLRLIKLAKSIKSFDSLYLLTASIASSASALVWSGALICIVQLSVALVLSTFLLPFCTDTANLPEDRALKEALKGQKELMEGVISGCRSAFGMLFGCAISLKPCFCKVTRSTNTLAPSRDPCSPCSWAS